MFRIVMLLSVCTSALSESLSRRRPKETTADLIKENNYPVEQHSVQTQDGYLLIMFRIPSAGPPVFLQHGLLCSSTDWVISGPGKALAYLLADAGYDVWLGNARGNTYGRRHVRLSPRSSQFWKFSWDEIGYYDLPAMIDHVLRQTGYDQLRYIGHSQGTTSFFVMTSRRPEYNHKIRIMHALAPIAFISHMKSPFLQIISNFEEVVDFAANFLGVNEFLPSVNLVRRAGEDFCHQQDLTQLVCTNIIFVLCGYDKAQMNLTLLPRILEHTPAGASTRQLIHYAQCINSGYFRRYNYGPQRNKQIYGTVYPPNYNLSEISVPIFLHYSDNDWMANVKDVKILPRQLRSLAGEFKIPYKDFNHLDYLWAVDAPKYLYYRLLRLLDMF